MGCTIFEKKNILIMLCLSVFFCTVSLASRGCANEAFLGKAKDCPAREPMIRRNVKGFMSFLGTPSKATPLAWCSPDVMVIAVPVQQSRGSVGPNAEKLRGGWREEGCDTYRVGKFFPDRGSFLDAYVGRWAFREGGCGGYKVNVGDTTIYRITFQPPGSSNNADVTCTCKDATCSAGAKWAYRTASHAFSVGSENAPDAYRGLASGSLLNVVGDVGADGEIGLVEVTDGYVFTSELIMDNVYIWPRSCSAVNGLESFPLIIDGCPVSRKLGFEVLTLVAGQNDQPARIVFRFMAFHFKSDEPLKVTCVMLSQAKRPTLGAFCNRRVRVDKHEALRRRLAINEQFMSYVNRYQEQAMSALHDENEKAEGKEKAEKEEEGKEKEKEEEEEAVSFSSVFGESFYEEPEFTGKGTLTIMDKVVGVGVNTENDLVEVNYAKGPFSFLQSLGLKEGFSKTNFGWKDVYTSVLAVEEEEELAVGVIKGKYGVNVDYSNLQKATMVDVIAGKVEVGTLVNVLDQDYGQRVKVGDFDILIRHDFDEFMDQDPDEVATEVFLGFKSVGVSVMTDLVDTEYGVVVSVKGQTVSWIQDFDEHVRRIQTNVGNGWQAVLAQDLPDEYSDKTFNQFGVGKLDKLYIAVGAGVATNKVPLATVDVQTRDTKVGVALREEDEQNLLTLSLGIGDVSYEWESVVYPVEVTIPILFQSLQDILEKP